MSTGQQYGRTAEVRLGQKVKKIADEVNKKYPYGPDKGVL
jgi:hypothetical protein